MEDPFEVCDEELHDEPPWDAAAKLTLLLLSIAVITLVFGCIAIGGAIYRAVVGS